MAKRGSKKTKDPIAAAAIRDAQKSIADEVNVPEQHVLHLTTSELDDLRLLCSYLGLGRDACLSAAVKYCCSIMSRTNVTLPVPKMKKESKTNRKEMIDYRVTAEAASDIRAKRTAFSPGWPTSEAEFVRMAIAVFAKKLLPPKSKRRNSDE